MIRLFFFLSFYSFICFGQINDNFFYKKSFVIDSQKEIKINNRFHLFFKNDENFIFNKMYYSTSKSEKPKLIDKVEYSPYKSSIHIFNSLKDKSYIVIWEIENEYFPEVKVYFFKNNEYKIIGNLDIFEPCNGCESYEFPIKRLKIVKNSNVIKFSFLKDVIHISNNKNLQTYKAGKIKYVYNLKSNSFYIKKW